MRGPLPGVESGITVAFPGNMGYNAHTASIARETRTQPLRMESVAIPVIRSVKKIVLIIVAGNTVVIIEAGNVTFNATVV